MGQFETRANHGKCYSQWTLPSALWINHEAADELHVAVRRIRDILRDEMRKDVSHKSAEKESVMAGQITPRYESKMTVFNRVVEDPRFLAREAEWLAMSRNRDREAE
jgi:hypothetical protein